MTSATYTANRATDPAPGVRVYWKISGIALGATAVLGILLNAVGLGDLLGGFLTFDWTHNVVHVLLAAIGISLGFGSASAALAKNAAKLFGIVYLGLAVVGFVTANLFGVGDLLGLHLEVGENLVHLVLGGWGAYVGFSD